MSQIDVINREMTKEELNRMYKGFDEHTIEMGAKVQHSSRFSYTAVDKGKFVGCSSGLAYMNDDKFNGWFYLTDLFVEKEYRSQGLGKRLLSAIEAKNISVGITNIWTWTAGYEAPGFYKKQGYHIFTEMKNWYSDGSSRVGFKKRLFN